LRDYERKVRATLRRLGSGRFRVQVDEASTIHQISRDAVHGVILAALNRASPEVGAASASSVVVRGTNGNLWHYATQGWIDTGLPIVGTPAVLEGAIHAIDVVARDAQNAPVHLYFDETQWHSQALPTSAAGTILPRGKLVGDPVAISTAPGAFDVVAQGPHSTTAPGTDFYHWHVTADDALLGKIAVAPHAVGLPALAGIAPDRLGLYYRDGDQTRIDPAPIPPGATECIEQPRVPYELAQDTGGDWQPAARLVISTSLLAFPAVANLDADTRLFFVSEGGGMWAANLTAGAVETRLSDFVPPGLRFDGSPARPVPASGGFAFHARTRDGNLARFVHDGGGWSYTAIPLDDDPARIIVDSPRGLPDGVLWTGADCEIHRHDDAGFDILDRTFTDGFDP
jgi:hypothetical protein